MITEELKVGILKIVVKVPMTVHRTSSQFLRNLCQGFGVFSCAGALGIMFTVKCWVLVGGS